MSNGKDFWEAFSRAVDNAFYDHGHSGYTGSICEKPGAYLVPTPKGVTAQDVAETIMAAQGWDSQRYGWSGMKPEFVERQNKHYELKQVAFAKVAKWFGQDEAEKIVHMSDDKWDDAIAVEMTASECSEVAEKDDDRWFFFFGWASS